MIAESNRPNHEGFMYNVTFNLQINEDFRNIQNCRYYVFGVVCFSKASSHVTSFFPSHLRLSMWSWQSLKQQYKTARRNRKILLPQITKKTETSQKMSIISQDITSTCSQETSKWSVEATNQHLPIPQESQSDPPTPTGRGFSSPMQRTSRQLAAVDDANPQLPVGYLFWKMRRPPYESLRKSKACWVCIRIPGFWPWPH